MRIGLKTVAGTAVALLTLFGSSVGGAENVLEFTGNNSYINLGTPTALQIPGNASFTVEGWVKFSALGGYRMLYSKNNARGAPYTYMFGVNGTAQMVAYTGFGGDPVNTWQAVSLSPALETGQWVHLAWSFDGTTMRFYRNGQFEGMVPYSFDNNAAHTIKIGGYANAVDIPGRLSEMRVWDTPRDGTGIRAVMHRRLGGAEPGLIGYWPLNEGAGTTVADGTDNASEGTLVNASWQTDEDLELLEAPVGYAYGGSFRLVNSLTGSERFTNSNEVDLVDFQVPSDYDQFQLTESGDPASLGAWVSTNDVAETFLFTQPASDTNVTLYAWFTNSATSVSLLRAEASIYYTEVAPVPAVRAALTIERLPGEPVVIEGFWLDTGSSGGMADEREMDVYARAALCASDPGCDATPNEPYVTLDVGTDSASLLLWLRNEAGNAIIGASTCTVTVVASTSGSTNRWTGDGATDLWLDPANWSAGVPYDGQHVRMTSGKNARLTAATAVMASFELAAGRTLTFEGWDSIMTATNMMIAGTITHADHLHVMSSDEFGDWALEHRIYLKGSNITIAAGATLDGDEMGYPATAGPGGAGGTRDGAGHAGRGSIGTTGGPVGGGPEYGNPVEPFQPGSGGTGHDAAGTRGGPGGGAIRIAADGHLQIAGTLSVNGRNGAASHGAGGSGGSIWISCRTFGGPATGLVRANGGTGHSQGGAGAGGRLALHYNPAAQADLAEPVPPVRFFGQAVTPVGLTRTSYPAAMSTLYLPDTLFITETMSGQRLWHVRPVIPGFTGWEPDALTLDHTVIGLPAGFALSVTNDLTLQNNARLHVFAAPVADPLSEDGAVVEVGGNLTLAGNSWIHPYACDTNGASVGFYIDGDLSIAEGSGFHADGLGFRWQQGPGLDEIRFSELGPNITINQSSAAGHGGDGGPGWNCGGGRAYGEAHAPRLPGTGGPREFSGRGGGVIRLVVAGHAEIHGILSAHGNSGNRHSQCGTGSGGSIWLVCRTLGGSETGMFQVHGGASRVLSGSGGGGRIAVEYDFVEQASVDAPAIRFSAAPGAGYGGRPFYDGEMGTLYFPDDQLVGALLENGSFQQARLVIPGFTSWAAGSSLSVGSGEVSFPSGFHLDVSDDLTLLEGARLHLHAAPTNSPDDVYGARLTVGGNLQINEDAWLYPHAEWTNGAVVGIRVAGNVHIAAGGGIDADGAGYAPMSDNKSGPGAGQNNSSGGGYGGHGGGTGGGAVYGTAAWPLAPGSPAGWYLYSNGLRACRGGGAIHLLAGGNVLLDGTLKANAQPGAQDYGGTGASGGAILLVGRRLTGSGLLQANGSLNRGRTNADGGGGRIAIWVGMPLQTAETRVASGYYSGVFVEDYPHFGGDMQALRASEAADDGTIEVYAISGSLIMLR